jgi:hypothetical protein
MYYEDDHMCVCAMEEQDHGFLVWLYSDLRGNRVSNGLYLIEIKAGAKLIKQKVLVTR